MMLSDEKKQMILRGLIEDSGVKIDDPVVFIDASDNPWIVDSSIEGTIKVVTGLNLWDKTTRMMEDFDRFTISVTGPTDVETPFKITRQDDPEFIEQVKQAIQLSNL